MEIEAPLSVGEVIDKVTILEIKLIKVKDENKLKFVKSEKLLLEEKLNNLKIYDNNALLELKNKLFEINTKLWEIEDKIRIFEKEKKFDDDFIALARSVYITNDKRFEVKNEINLLFNTSLREIKDYQEY
tara:strand:+ start:215 stop:604 length:390 start_codon:yes stop_codon:yes gene_type:complete